MKRNFYKRKVGMSFCHMALLVCAIFWTSLAKADAQQGKWKPERLDSYLKKVEQAYKVSFVYDAAEISKSLVLEVPEKTYTIQESLEPLKQKNIGYRLVGTQVILKVQEPVAVQRKDITVKGVVKDKKDGKPVPGVSVFVKGSGQVVSTNEQGEYQLTIKDEKAILVFRYLGYKTVEMAVNGKTKIDVELEEDAGQLKEVNIVSTGYQTLEKKTFTGAATLVKASDAERAGVTDVSRMLEGQVAGVTVQNVSGTFGAAPKIRVRGATSFSGDNKPLWVVDGIILEDVVNISNEALTSGDASTLIGSSVAGLNPDDIESFNILKDAAATGMYGARAMNGVVVVTTKKGKLTEGAPKISYRGNFTTYAKPSYADFDILNSADQMAVLIEMQNKGYVQIPSESRGVSGGPFYKMYNMLYNYDPVTKTYALKNTSADKIAFLSRYANANTDWFDVLFKNSLQQEHSLSISSGTEKFKSYASTSFTKDNGVTIGNNVSRFTGNYRANFNVSDKLSAELLSTGSVRNQQAPGATSLQSDPVYGNYFRSFDINPYSYAVNTSRMLTAYDENGNYEYFRQNSAPFSILNELNSNYLKLGVLDFKVQGNLTYKIIPSLSYSVDGAYRFVKSETQISILESSNMATSFRTVDDATSAQSNTNLYTDPDIPGSLPISVLPSGGFYKTSTDNLKSYYFRQNLSFNKTINTKHNITAFGAMEVRYIDRQRESFDGVGYQFDNGGLVTPYYKYFKEAAEEGKPYFSMGNNYERYTAFFANASYTYNEKYTLRLSGRYDGSNLLGKTATARWLPTWNVAGSWNISDEDFWPKSDILSGAKLRASYGLVASIGNATNSAAVFYNQVSRRPNLGDQEAQIYISNLENSELTWEKTKDLNIGLDLALIKNRINFTVDLYKRNIFDLIGAIQTSGIGGEYTKIANYGAMSGKGIELAITGKAIDNPNFKWTTNFNFGYNTNKVKDLEIDPNIFKSTSNNGSPVLNFPQRSLFSVQFAGLNHDYGYPMFVGVDGRTTTYINLQDNNLVRLKYEGPIDPTFAGGFYNQFSYKNFTLSALLGFSAGNMIRLNPNIKSSFDDISSMSRDLLNRWVMPGDEKFTSVPAILDPLSASKIVDANGSAIDIRYAYNLYNFSTERVAKGDYIKLRQVALSYNLPKSFFSKLGMSAASVSLVGNNLLLLYSDKRLNGQDPEFYNSGGVALPVSRQYTLSLKVGF
ncbi:SusC/RagA family TonB-linked outer membrane protein [Pedobacter sp. KR3-3]|uniref:SusC/RagA family TonB-linked outer membrane protein n=1 Tax=Pedobacter albus TaxID=3113905 RepID=A0ABU7I986_9SPHI|nr:SusC/RagA family TonB-linked outer membrane protein [Pedobacter sp. KR3-3]MEE1946040.1 SusC/RagA family TonB-linked outer membrane protein [Pedobacter sp. KR3-3]